MFEESFGSRAKIFAIGGDRIQEIGWRLQNGMKNKLIQCNPQKIVILIGTNDFGEFYCKIQQLVLVSYMVI